MRKVWRRGLVILLAVGLLLPTAVGEASALSVTAGAAIVMDYETGEVLYGKDIDTMRVPASMTKIMTAYLIFEELERGNLTMDTVITVSEAAAVMSLVKEYDDAVPLREGATMTVEQALQLILLPSGNAVSFLMAEHIGGTEAAFVERMNETAAAMGLQAEFISSHGLPPHYISAWSVAELVRQTVARFPQILGFTALKSVGYEGRVYNNTNLLLSSRYYAGVDGLKTGTTLEAGYCLAATGVKDGKRIVTVVMNSRSHTGRFTDTKALLDYGFAERERRAASRQASRLSFGTLPQELRRNADHPITVRIDGMTADYSARAQLLLNGEIVTETGDILVTKDNDLQVNLYLAPDYPQTTATLEFHLLMPDGTKQSLAAELPVSAAEPALYRDLNCHWAEGAVASQTAQGIFSGDENGYFKPDGGMSRAMFVTVLGRAAEALDLSTTVRRGITAFADVPANQYYSKYVAWAAETGLVQGDGSHFRPDENISREAAAAILDRFAELCEIELPTVTATGSIADSFADQEAISSWAAASVKRTTAAGLLSGYNDGTFQPQRTATRAEAAWMLEGFLGICGIE